MKHTLTCAILLGLGLSGGLAMVTEESKYQ